MKYKADYSKKMTFHQVLSSFNSDKKYISYSTQKNIDKEKLFESRIISFNIFGEIFIDGKHDDTGRYQELIKLDWFEVHEVKEEPKKEEENQSDVVKEHIRRLKEHESVKENMIRAICREEIAKENDGVINRGLKPTTTINTLLDKLDKKVVEKFLHGSWDALFRSGVIQKPKKQKQEFDGEKKIYITKDGSDHLYACTDGIVNSAYRLATQSDINKFFKASKKRIKISEKYDKPSNRSFYFKNGVKYYHDLRSGSYYTYGKDNYIKYITEQEYFEGLK